MSLYKKMSLDQCQSSLAECYHLLSKLEKDPIIENAKKKIMETIDDLNKVSDSIAQHLEERR